MSHSNWLIEQDAFQREYDLRAQAEKARFAQVNRVNTVQRNALTARHALAKLRNDLLSLSLDKANTTDSSTER